MMNRKEVSIVKKTLDNTNDNFNGLKVITAVINGKTVKSKSCKIWDALSLGAQEEILSMCKKSLSGKFGKSLVEYDFEEVGGEKQDFLLTVVNDHFESKDVVNAYIDKIKNTVVMDGTYCVFGVIFTLTRTDKIIKTTHENEYMLTFFCPVKMRNDGFILSGDGKLEHKGASDCVVEAPVNGFLFPTIDSGYPDHRSVMFFNKGKEINKSIINELIGCNAQFSSEDQKSAFWGMVSSVVGDDMDFDTVTTINSKMAAMQKAAEDDNDYSVVSVSDARRALTSAGVSEEKIDEFEDKFVKKFGRISKDVIACNISEENVTIKNSEVKINLGYDRASAVRTKVIDGEKCICIPITDTHIEVNDISTKFVLNHKIE